jgi:hypothetical protein
VYSYKITFIISSCLVLLVSSERPIWHRLNFSPWFKRLSISFLIVINRDFSRRTPSNGLVNWLSKYSHPLFWVFHWPKVDSDNGSLECAQDIEKLSESEKYRKFYANDSLNDDLESEF